MGTHEIIEPPHKFDTVAISGPTRTQGCALLSETMRVDLAPELAWCGIAPRAGGQGMQSRPRVRHLAVSC